MPDADEKQRRAQCPHCRQGMEFLEKRYDMPPFWTIHPRFFSLPFQTDALLLILLVSLCASAMQLNAPLTILLGFLLLFVVVNYALTLAHNLIRNSRPPSNGDTHKIQVPGIASALDFKQVKNSLAISLLLITSLLPPVLLLNYVSGVGALIYALISLAILPSILLVLIHSDKHPGRPSSPPPSGPKIIKTMRGSYLSLVAFFSMTYFSTLLVADLTQSTLPAYAMAATYALLISYFVIALFSILAYVLKRYDSFSAVGASRSHQDEHDNTPSESTLRLNADLDIAVKDGDYSKALSLLEGCLKGRRSDLRVHQLYTLLLEHKDLARLEQHSHGFFELLLGRGQKLAAYELFELLKNSRQQFRIHELSLSLNLAEAFYEMKEYKLVLYIAKEAHLRFNTDTDLAKLYLLTAKTILSKSNTPEKARPYLLYISEHLPGTEFTLAAQRLLEHLKTP